jgi:hypothetical protein
MDHGIFSDGALAFCEQLDMYHFFLLICQIEFSDIMGVRGSFSTFKLTWCVCGMNSMPLGGISALVALGILKDVRLLIYFSNSSMRTGRKKSK